MLRRAAIETVKNVVAATLYRSGLLRLILNRRFRNAAAILMYHRVLPEDGAVDSFSADSIVVTPTEFDWQMRLLGEYMRPLPLEDFYDFFDGQSRATPARACLVTFDDGWFDNHDYALPVLQRRRVPAVVFVATSYVGTDRCFWQEALGRLVHRAWQDADLGRRILPLLGAPMLADAAAADVRRLSRELITELKRLPRSELQALLARVHEACAAHGVDFSDTGDDRFMSWAQVAALGRSDLVAIQSHAVSHIPLDQLNDADARAELTESRREIEARTGRNVAALAYPNGDFDDAVVGAAREAGYRFAVTTEEGVAKAGDDPLRLCRISIHKHAARTPARFLCRIAGVL